jgi:hypothetical protein
VNENAKAAFSQVGVSGEKARIIKGFGKNMPFNISMDVIVPTDWSITHNEGAELELLKWDGGVSWPYVLKNLSEENDISVSINWEKKHVDLFSHTANKKEIEKVKEVDELVDLFNNEQESIKNKLLLANEKEIREKLEIENKLNTSRLQAKLDAEKENKNYITKLENDKKVLSEEKEVFETELSTLKGIVDSQSEKNIALVVNDEIIIDKENELKIDTVELKTEEYKSEYDKREILPIESSFDFFTSGGYEQEFDYYTPATFIAKKGKTINEVLSSWADSIGWDITYNTRVHYTVDFDMVFEGIYKESSTSLIKLYKDAPRPLDIEFYTDQKLIVVKDLEFK